MLFSNQQAKEYSLTARTVSDVLCVLGSLFLAGFGIKSHVAGMDVYAFCLYAFAVACMGSFFIYKKWGNWSAHRNFLVVGFAALYLFLLGTGGEENTGILWCYAFPLIIFTWLGPQQGVRVVMALLVLSAIVLYRPEWVGATHGYSDNMIYRFSGSILFVSAMAYVMERARMNAQLAGERANRALRKLVRSDELTNTLNRRGINEKVRLELHRVARDRRELSVVLCDIDLFKAVNDQYGHDVGDQALRHVAQLLRDNVRVIDSVGRWGGEEFLILLPNTSMAEAFQLIERVRELIASHPISTDHGDITLSISCGLASTRFESRFDDLIKAADVSLYKAKEEGRNCTRPKVA